MSKRISRRILIAVPPAATGALACQPHANAEDIEAPDPPVSAADARLYRLVMVTADAANRASLHASKVGIHKQVPDLLMNGSAGHFVAETILIHVSGRAPARVTGYDEIEEQMKTPLPAEDAPVDNDWPGRIPPNMDRDFSLPGELPAAADVVRAHRIFLTGLWVCLMGLDHVLRSHLRTNCRGCLLCEYVLGETKTVEMLILAAETEAPLPAGQALTETFGRDLDVQGEWRLDARGEWRPISPGKLEQIAIQTARESATQLEAA
jgi:hypothetical protein